MNIVERFGPRVEQKYFELLHRFRVMLIASGTTPSAVADRLKIDRANFSRYLSGKTMMPLVVYVAVLSLLGRGEKQSEWSPETLFPYDPD